MASLGIRSATQLIFGGGANIRAVAAEAGEVP